MYQHTKIEARETVRIDSGCPLSLSKADVERSEQAVGPASGRHLSGERLDPGHPIVQNGTIWTRRLQIVYPLAIRMLVI